MVCGGVWGVSQDVSSMACFGLCGQRGGHPHVRMVGHRCALDQLRDKSGYLQSGDQGGWVYGGWSVGVDVVFHRR